VQHPVLTWILANAAWLGYPVMAILGGAISHILAFENSTVRWTIRQHVGLLVIAWVKAFFIAACILWIQLEYTLSLPLCFFLTGILSVFGTDTIKKLREMGSRLIFGRVGVPYENKRENDGPNS
jgi:hypothetical protein